MAMVKLFGALRDRAGIGMVEIPEEMTIGEILEYLARTYGEAVGGLLLEEREGETVRREPVVILIGGIAQPDLGRPVATEETVTIFPAVAGG